MKIKFIFLFLITSFYLNAWKAREFDQSFVNYLASCNVPLVHSKRPGMYPFIAGDTFRKFSDHIFDETDFDFKPETVKLGDSVFVNSNFLEPFFKYMHPLIQHKYILVTHNEDISVPGKFHDYIEDKKIFAWFGQNCNLSNHPKLIPIPIGLENKHWGRHYDILISNLYSKNLDKKERTCFLYSNFNIDTNPKIRKPILEYFKNQNFCYTVNSKKDYLDYLIDVCNSKFILSPQGNGLDCHRTWEALYLGAIPIIKTSSIDQLFENLPVLIINDWADITENFLQEKYKEIKNKTYKLEKLHFDYWKNLISKYQDDCRYKI